jgi:hypothetical protein
MAFGDYAESAGAGAASGAATGSAFGPWGAAIGGVVGAGIGILGESNKEAQAKKIRDLANNRPKYSRPQEIDQMLANARAGTTEAMPGYDIAKQNIDQSAAAGATNIKNLAGGSGNALAASQNLAKSQMNMYSNLAMQNEQYHRAEKDKLQQALRESAKYSDQEFEYNQNQPWQFNMNWAENKYGASQQSSANTQRNMYALAGEALKAKAGQSESGGYQGWTGSNSASFDNPGSDNSSNIG